LVKENNVKSICDWDAAPEDGRDGFQPRDLWRFIAVEIIISILAGLFLDAWPIASADGYVLTVLAGKLVLMAYLAWLVLYHRGAWRATGAATAGRLRRWLLALAVYLLAYPLALAADRLNEALIFQAHAWLGFKYEPVWQEAVAYVFSGRLARTTRLILILFIVFFGPLVEEFAFRGVGMDAFRRSGGTPRAVILTSLLFGLFHFNPAILLPISLLGMVFGLARTLSGSLWCGLTIHCLHNAISLLLAAGSFG
jgi:membrane protease YdiL (CAAX protease family)